MERTTESTVFFFNRAMEFVNRQYYRYNLWTGLYMLDWWERLTFNVAAFGVTAAAGYYSYNFIVSQL